MCLNIITRFDPPLIIHPIKKMLLRERRNDGNTKYHTPFVGTTIAKNGWIIANEPSFEEERYSWRNSYSRCTKDWVMRGGVVHSYLRNKNVLIDSRWGDCLLKGWAIGVVAQGDKSDFGSYAVYLPTLDQRKKKPSPTKLASFRRNVDKYNFADLVSMLNPPPSLKKKLKLERQL
jgi:hypothetical protein